MIGIVHIKTDDGFISVIPADTEFAGRFVKVQRVD